MNEIVKIKIYAFMNNVPHLIVTALLLLASVTSTEEYCPDGGVRRGGTLGPRTSTPEGRVLLLHCLLSRFSFTRLELYKMA